MSIQFKFFHISSRTQDEEEALNTFLRSNRVIAVHREFVADKENSFWSFAVEYLVGASQNSRQSSAGAGKKRVDYKEVLSPDDFSVFATLRGLEGVGEARVEKYGEAVIQFMRELTKPQSKTE